MHEKFALRHDAADAISNLKSVPILLGLVLSIASSLAEARVYRCTDAGGNIAYSQTPCPAGEASAKVPGVRTTSNADREACTHVRQFAADTFEKLKGGTEPGMLIEEYGGPGYINPVTLNIVNFVSGFRFNQQVSPLKVGVMAYNKCTNRGFGKLRVGELPAEILPQPDPMEQMQPPMQLPPQGAPVAGTYTQEAAGNSDWQHLCQNYQLQLDNVDRAMQAGYDAERGQQMRQQYQGFLQQYCR